MIRGPPCRLHVGASVGCPGFLSDRDLEDGRYPPGPRPPAGGGGGSCHPHRDGHGNTLGGDSYPSFGNPQGTVIAKIVSPIVSVVVVTLTLGAASYFQYNRRRNCFRTNEPENILGLQNPPIALRKAPSSQEPPSSLP
ncbi:LOW QUALITY PROTEIN: glycoprotein Xg-like [Tursiops truncatus]|uniref:LOW QUALITY PROTEIN: glycoprotein Xg-like n=1 Tax=Tursiops truncatus TaxID=9739 RepID=UPI003CCF699D